MTVIFTALPETETSESADKNSSGKSENTGVYHPVEFGTEITAKDPRLGEKRTVQSKRTVYQREGIDLDLEIPAGTKFSNGKSVKSRITNRELMKKGSAPFVYVKDEAGNRILVQIELHHITSQETSKGSVYFTGRERDGSIAEVPSSIHKKQKKVIHVSLKDGSFRVDDLLGGKSFDANKFEKFRKIYWKKRLEKIEGESR